MSMENIVWKKALAGTLIDTLAASQPDGFIVNLSFFQDVIYDPQME